MITVSKDRWSSMLWNLVGQGGSALLGLALIKVSVSAFPISAYGIASLLIGLHNLVRTTALNPLLNLAIYASSGKARVHGLGWIYQLTIRSTLGVGLLMLPILGLAIWGLQIRTESPGLAWLLLGGFLFSEAVKTARFNLLHCRDLNRRYALWILADAAAKLAAVTLVAATCRRQEALILVAAQVTGSFLMLVASCLDPRIRQLERERLSSIAPINALNWTISHRAFLLPLVGVGLTGWVTGLSDRYLVNHFLGSDSAGLYAGVYALFSAPFLISGGAVILAVRPAILRLDSEGRVPEWKQLYRHSLLLMILWVASLALLLFTTRHFLIRLVLTPAYTKALSVVPGLLIGNGILALGIFLEQIFYIRHRTSLVLFKQMIGSICAITFVAIAVPRWGLIGVGWACPLYAIIELLTALGLIKFLYINAVARKS